MSVKDELNRMQDFKDSDFNESNTIQRLVLPVLEELGWNSRDPDKMHFELPIPKGKEKIKADIALLSSSSPRKPCMIIEVKAKNTILGRDTDLDQIWEYAFRSKVPLITLTNGIEWWLYYVFDKDPDSDGKFAKLNIINDSIDDLNKIFETYFSYKSLVKNTESTMQKAEQALTVIQKLPEIWQELLNEPPKELYALIRKKTFASVGIKPTKEQMSSFLSEQKSERTESVKISTKSKPVSSTRKAKQKNQKKPVEITILGDRRPVNSWIGVWKEVAYVLYNRHSDTFHQVVGKPNGKSSHVELDKKTQHHKLILNSKYWIHCNTDSNGVKKRCSNLLELLGHREDDLVIHF